MKRVQFKPVVQRVYKNRNGNEYLCLYSSEYQHFATFISRGGWCFNAVGVGLYDDGTIDWDYSTEGYFAEKNLF